MSQHNNPLQPIFNVTSPQKAPLGEEISNRLLARVADAQLQGLKEQRSGISATKKRLEKIQGGPKKKDLSALFAIGDILSGTGGKYSKLYQTIKPKDTKKEELALEKMLSSQRMGLADDEINFLKTQFQAVKDSSKISKDLTPAQKSVDRQFGKTYETFIVGGGYGDVEKGLQQLEEVSSQLGSFNTAGEFVPNQDITGGKQAYLPMALRRRFSPESAAAQQSVEEVVQRNLRLILGAQFTEREGERLISRAYDSALGEQENKKRVDRLIKSMRVASDSKKRAATYYEENGTLKGYKGLTGKEIESQFLEDAGGTTTSKTSKKAPEVGTERSGYRFMGGDPSIPDSWEKL